MLSTDKQNLCYVSSTLTGVSHFGQNWQHDVCSNSCLMQGSKARKQTANVKYLCFWNWTTLDSKQPSKHLDQNEKLLYVNTSKHLQAAVKVKQVKGFCGEGLSFCFAKLFVKLNLSLVVAAPQNIVRCKYLIAFVQRED